MHAAVVLMEIARGVRVHDGRLQIGDRTLDQTHGRVPLGDAGVLEILQSQRGIEQACCRCGLSGTPLPVASSSAMTERQYRHGVACHSVADQRAADPDLDIVRMRADGENSFDRPRRGFAFGQQLFDLGDQISRRDRLGQEVVDLAPQGADCDVHPRISGHQCHGHPTRPAFNQNIDTRTAAGLSAIDNMQRSLLTWLVVASVLGGLATIAGLVLLTNGIVRRLAAVSRNAHELSAHRPLAHIHPAPDEIGVMVNDLKGASALLAQSNVELGVSRDKAIRATQAKNDFLSRVSHELRTPLTAIIGFGQLLQLEDLSHDDRDSVDHIVTAGHRLHDLINDLIDISQIESGNLFLSVEPVRLHELFDETIAMLQPMAATFGVREPVVTLSSNSPPTVWADRRRLKQVLLNLISNAIKYNVIGGGIEVRGVFIGEASVRIEVIDTGRAISSGVIDRLFQPFERLDAEHSGIEGTGVGLALSKSLVEAMRGTIGVESVKDHGSTFWVQLPRAESEIVPSGLSSDAPLAESSSLVPASAPTTSALPINDAPIVLYVEDNAASIALVRLVFASRTERLEVIGQGGLVRDIATGLQPCLILLDQHPPDMNGEDALLRRKADQRTCDIPVVIVSAEPSATRRERVLELGALDYVGKPLDPRRLNALVDRVVRTATLHA